MPGRVTNIRPLIAIRIGTAMTKVVNGYQLASISSQEGVASAVPAIAVDVFEPSSGQTDFTLTYAPTRVELFVNGQRQFDTDFVVTGTDLKWVSPDFTLAPSDTIMAQYNL
jgi:hypothetical protein